MSDLSGAPLLDDRWQTRDLQPADPSSFAQTKPIGDRNELISAQIAGQYSSANATDEEVNELLAQRKSLIERKFEDGLSVFDDWQLEFIRWKLDNIDMARHGAGVADLYRKVELYRSMAERISGLSAELEAHRVHHNELNTANSIPRRSGKAIKRRRKVAV